VTVTAIFSPASLPVSVRVDPTRAGLLLAELDADAVADWLLPACPAVPVVTV
jgi:hypothetical protein